jgi:hypothetical protein
MGGFAEHHGVYGDWSGALVREVRPLFPQDTQSVVARHGSERYTNIMEVLYIAYHC